MFEPSNENREPSDEIMDELIGESRHHKTVNGDLLVEQRNEMGLTQAAFAAKCNWSQPFQSRLERPGKHEITAYIAKTIAKIAVSGNITD